MPRPIDPNLRIELLSAAEVEFGLNGVEATRIEDIVRRAGRSKGAFYQYFDSKEQVFRLLSESLLASLERIISQQLIDEPKPWTREQFLLRWRMRDEEIFEFVWINRDMVRMILVAGFHADFASLMNEFARRCYEVAFEGMNWGRSVKLYRRDLDLRVISSVIAGGYDRLARDVVAAPKRPPIARWVADLQRFILHGVLDGEQHGNGA